MSDSYVFRYAIIMVVLVAAVLSAVAMVLKPAQDKNVAVARKQAILAAANIKAEPANTIELYNQYIVEEEVISPEGEVIGVFRDQKLVEGDVRAFDLNLKEELYKKGRGEEYHLPLYIADVNGTRMYIFPLLGRGLWGPVYGNLALGDDLNTVVGSMFGHDKETPGLGAEIELPMFESQFLGKQIFDEKGNFTSIMVLKGASKVLPPQQLIHGVDAITGGTITSNGVSDMLRDNLKSYLPYIQKQKSI